MHGEDPDSNCASLFFTYVISYLDSSFDSVSVSIYYFHEFIYVQCECLHIVLSVYPLVKIYIFMVSIDTSCSHFQEGPDPALLEAPPIYMPAPIIDFPHPNCIRLHMCLKPYLSPRKYYLSSLLCCYCSSSGSCKKTSQS